jgi:hypothetical protein
VLHVAFERNNVHHLKRLFGAHWGERMGKDWEGISCEDSVLAVVASTEWDHRNVESRTDFALDKFVVGWDRVMWSHVEWRPEYHPTPNTIQNPCRGHLYLVLVSIIWHDYRLKSLPSTQNNVLRANIVSVGCGIFGRDVMVKLRKMRVVLVKSYCFVVTGKDCILNATL